MDERDQPNRSPELYDLRIEPRPIASLKLRRNNPRTHSEKQIRQIAASIETFGFTNPVLIDASQTVIAGHGRVRAAKLLGMETVPTVRLEHLSADQVRAYVIADNGHVDRQPSSSPAQGNRPSQDPAKARGFLGESRAAGAESLHPQTGWRWMQAGANPSPRPIP